MSYGRRLLVAAVIGMGLPLAGGCRTYEVWQSDNWKSADFRPENIKRAAVVMFAPWSEVGGQKIEVHGVDETLDRNKTFGEAVIISLQQRGMRIVEQQAVDVAQREARLVLSKESDVVSTRELAERLGRQLQLDAVIYADALYRGTYFEFQKKAFGANESEAKFRENEANQRGGITPEDARKCEIIAHHNVGLSVRVVDITTGRILWAGFRSLSVAEEYDDRHPDALTTFSTVQKLCEKLVEDIFGVQAGGPSPSASGRVGPEAGQGA